MATVTISTYSASDQTFNVPSDFNPADNLIEVYSHSGTASAGTSGAGGNGGGGGGGGGYAVVANVALTAGGTATFRLRDVGAGNTDADACWFNGTSLAGSSVGIRGGSNAVAATGGAGAVTTNAIGDTTRPGGDGANGATGSGNQAGGGGGGAAGSTGNGGNASGTTAGTAGGGDAGAGGAGGPAGNNAGANGNVYGGAPGGGGKTNGARAQAGVGTGGFIRITYTPIAAARVFGQIIG